MFSNSLTMQRGCFSFHTMSNIGCCRQHVIPITISLHSWLIHSACKWQNPNDVSRRKKTQEHVICCLTDSPLKSSMWWCINWKPSFLVQPLLSNDTSYYVAHTIIMSYVCSLYFCLNRFPTDKTLLSLCSYTDCVYIHSHSSLMYALLVNICMLCFCHRCQRP